MIILFFTYVHTSQGASFLFSFLFALQIKFVLCHSLLKQNTLSSGSHLKQYPASSFDSSFDRWKSSLPRFGLASDCQIVTLQSPLLFRCTLTMPVWLCLQIPDKEFGGTSEKWNDLVHEKGKISLPELRINPHFLQALPLAKESYLLIS